MLGGGSDALEHAGLRGSPSRGRGGAWGRGRGGALSRRVCLELCWIRLRAARTPSRVASAQALRSCCAHTVEDADCARAGGRPAPLGGLGAADAGEDRARIGRRVRIAPAREDNRLPSEILTPMTRARITPGDGRGPLANSAPRTRVRIESARDDG